MNLRNSTKYLCDGLMRETAQDSPVMCSGTGARQCPPLNPGIWFAAGVTGGVASRHTDSHHVATPHGQSGCYTVAV